jgi:hypothetical protein
MRLPYSRLAGFFPVWAMAILIQVAIINHTAFVQVAGFKMTTEMYKA